MANNKLKANFSFDATFLYNASGELIGTCDGNKFSIAYAFAAYKQITHATRLNKTYLRDMFKTNFDIVLQHKLELHSTVTIFPKTTESIYVRERKNATYNNFMILHEFNAYRKKVYDGESIKMLHIIPSKMKISIKRLTISEMIELCAMKVTEPVVMFTAEFFPKSLIAGEDKTPGGLVKYSQSAELSQRMGWIQSKGNLPCSCELFTISHAIKAIHRLERNGYIFTKNSIYKEIIKTYK